MNAPAALKYTKSDEWFNPESGKAGLSDYAQAQLSDIVFVEILEQWIGTLLAKVGDENERSGRLATAAFGAGGE